MLLHYPYSYINLQALCYLLQYEGKRSIKIDVLKKYHQVLLEEILKYYNGVIRDSVGDRKDRKVEIVCENDNMTSFLKEFSKICYLRDDTLYLCDDIDYYDLASTMTVLAKQEDISYNFDYLSVDQKLFDLLKINKIRKIVTMYLEVEKKIEKLYQKIGKDMSKEEEKRLRKLLMIRNIFILNVKKEPEYRIDAFNTAVKLMTSEDDLEYDIDPVNARLWEENIYRREHLNEGYPDINDIMEEPYHYAIFGSGSLYFAKMEKILDDLYFAFDDDEEDDEIENDEEDYRYVDTYDEPFDEDDMFYNEFDNASSEDPSKIDLLFYLNYLNKIDEYMERYGVNLELLKVKNRLLYILDEPTLLLYDYENFYKAFEEANEDDCPNDSFKHLEGEMRFMAEEVFKTKEDKNTIKKLILIETYYDLSHDEEIGMIVNSFKGHEKYNEYYAIIFDKKKYYRAKKI